MMLRHQSSPRRPRNSSEVVSRRGRRHHRLFPALVLLALSDKSLALISPTQQWLSLQHTFTQPYDVKNCHRRRIRGSFELQLQSSSSSQDNTCVMSRSNIPLSLSPSLLFLKNHLPPCSYPTTIHYEKRCRMSTTSLLMAQSSESTGSGGFGKDDDKKKKRENGDSNSNPRSKANKGTNNDSNAASRPYSNNPRSKANKGTYNDSSATSLSPGVAKGASPASDNNSAKKKQTPKRSNKRRNNNNNKMSNNKKQKNKTGNQSRGGKAKTNAKSNDSSTLNTNTSKGGSIKTSGQNTSLKGFKSEKQRTPPPQMKQQPEKESTASPNNDNEDENVTEGNLQKRVVQLEMIVSTQMLEMQKLRREIEDLKETTKIFSNVIDVLRDAGLKIDEEDEVKVMDEEVESREDDGGVGATDTLSTNRPYIEQQQTSFLDDMEIFGMAPKSVTDAADAAGASILAAILAGKHRMLVDVRDAELTRDPKLFVEFIELAILPVAAGLEGLDGDEYVRNRVKIVFPTVKELMSYRRSMALAAPEVVSLSTLGFDPVDERDNLIVVIAPSPDDLAGVAAMEKLIARTDQSYVEPDQRITQPVVVINHHMVPVDNIGGFGKPFTSVYHLRLLSVQYMTGDASPEYVAKGAKSKDAGDSVGKGTKKLVVDNNPLPDNPLPEATENQNSDSSTPGADGNNKTDTSAKAAPERSVEEDEALEAAMIHAHEIGVHQGVTRAMVIRAYPKPWHVFVDTSPDTDADFEVAATFDSEPTQEDVNYAIVECLEGSEREDEIVAQQMQAALESGQLNRVSDMLGISPSDMVSEDNKAASISETENDDDDDKNSDNDDDTPYDGNDWDDLYYDDWFSEDSV